MAGKYIETDHQPLIAISKKCLGDMPPRLQRLFLRLMKYDYLFSYVPGKLLVLADTLSRAPSPCSQTVPNANDDVEVHAVSVRSSVVSERTGRTLVQETARDPVLSRVMEALLNHQPLIGQYKSYASELSVIDGLLFKGTKVVIPRVLRPEMLRKLHAGHLGINKSKTKARRLMFWPGMSQEIRDMIDRCETCKVNSYAQPEEPLLMRPSPSSPWTRVGADLCQYAGKTYLVVYDAHSNYPEVEQLESTTAPVVISKLSSIFARHGIPLEVLTDNGPQFSSREFATFAADYDFRHITSSPRFPRSNGLAEKGVQIVKRILKKTCSAGGDFYQGLLNYRTSPLECGQSPSELLMGRRLRCGLPDFTLSPGDPPTKRTQRRTTRGALPGLHPGDVVRMRSDKGWTTKAQVKDQVAPRSYKVVTEDGAEYRRNRQHLRATPEAFNIDRYPEEWTTPRAAQERPMTDSSGETSMESESRDPPLQDQDGPQPNVDLGPSASAHAPDPAPVRHSNRTRRAPRRLSYDRNFDQEKR